MGGCSGVYIFEKYNKIVYNGPGRCPLDPARNSVRNGGMGSSGALTATPFMQNTMDTLQNIPENTLLVCSSYKHLKSRPPERADENRLKKLV